jgi:broad specificity phosphatase PhoE
MLRLMLIRHGATAAVRAASFAADEPLEPAAREMAAALGPGLPGTRTGLSGPELACRETAERLGLDAGVEADLAGLDMGSWRGRTLEEVQDRDPTGLMAWMSDPDATPHGGESLAAYNERITGWLDAAAVERHGFVIATVDAAVIKAAVLHALAAPPAAFWRVDASPLRVTELHGSHDRWSLRTANSVLAPR